MTDLSRQNIAAAARQSLAPAINLVNSNPGTGNGLFIPERRLNFRATTSCPVLLISDADPLAALAIDISDGGAKIILSTPIVLAVGSKFTLFIADQTSVICEIRWHSDNTLGIGFIDRQSGVTDRCDGDHTGVDRVLHNLQWQKINLNSIHAISTFPNFFDNLI